MKQYKLKKWYPSLPKELKVGTEVIYYPVSETYSDNYLGIKSIVDLHPEEVEDNPEFWEKVLQPKFEILSFKNSDDEHFVMSEDGIYRLDYEKPSRNDWRTLQWMLENATKCYVYSIKRLSDNKVFTLGDTVFYQDNTFIKWEIDNFFLRDNGVLLARSKNNEMVETIDTIKKVDPIIFLSEDGKELTEKDEYYVVGPRFNFIQDGKPQSYPSFTKNKTKYFVFASKEYARMFISENKPCLSVKDVQQAINNKPVFDSPILPFLKELVLKKSNL